MEDSKRLSARRVNEIFNEMCKARPKTTEDAKVFGVRVPYVEVVVDEDARRKIAEDADKSAYRTIRRDCAKRNRR